MPLSEMSIHSSICPQSHWALNLPEILLLNPNVELVRRNTATGISLQCVGDAARVMDCMGQLEYSRRHTDASVQPGELLARSCEEQMVKSRTLATEDGTMAGGTAASFSVACWGDSGRAAVSFMCPESAAGASKLPLSSSSPIWLSDGPACKSQDVLTTNKTLQRCASNNPCVPMFRKSMDLSG